MRGRSNAGVNEHFVERPNASAEENLGNIEQRRGVRFSLILTKLVAVWF